MISAVVKYPSKVASEPDRRFCGQCGRRCQPIINDNVGFGPCIEGADNVLDCRDFRVTIVSAHQIAEVQKRPIHPETQALIDRLGIPASSIEEWVGEYKRRQATAEYLRCGEYGQADGAPFMPALIEWVAAGNAHEKIIALIDELKVHLDPTEGGTKALSYLEICEWFDRLGDEAKETLSDPGDWEMSDGEAA